MFDARTITALVLVAFGGAVAASSLSPATFQHGASQESDTEDAFQRPAPEHVEMLKAVGEWEGLLTWSFPGMPSGESRATETIRALGPYHTVASFQSQFGGAPYEGLGVMSFDPATGELMNTWSDSMTPATLLMRGTLDDESRVGRLSWVARGPDGALVPHRNVTTHGKDAYESIFYMGEGADEVEVMTISMKRVK
ncbi:MAG: DUF1579 family protein [Planctomycetota bacterium]